MTGMTDSIDAYGEVTKAEIKTEDGLEYPAAAYAYTPDKDTPSGWKLRLWETPELEETRRQVGMGQIGQNLAPHGTGEGFEHTLHR